MQNRVHALVYFGVFLISGVALALEVCLTRVLSIMMWHHFTYVVIGIALLGFGAAGSILQLADAEFLNHRIEVTGGVLGGECADQLRAFFKARR